MSNENKYVASYQCNQNNKRSTRYTCCDKYTKKCGGSITISQDKVTRSADNTGHTCLTDNQIKILV